MRAGFAPLIALAFAFPGLEAPAPQSPAAPHARPSARSEHEYQDLVLFGEARSYLVRLHLHVDGRPFQASWEESLGALFRYLDADGDGVLSAAELRRAPSPGQFVQILQGGSDLEPDAAPTLEEVAGAGKRAVTRDNFKAFYRKSKAAPLQVYWGSRSGKGDVLTDALFAALDRDRDGRLSREELEAAPGALARFDADNDEMITASELAVGSPVPAYNFSSTADDGPKLKAATFALVDPDAPDAALALLMLKRYDRDGDGKLTAAECGLDAAALARLDTNHDGRLDAAELAHWALQPPDIEMVLQLGESLGPRATLSPPREGAVAPAGVRRSTHGSLLAALPGALLGVSAGNGSLAGRKALRKRFEDEFRSLDANKDGVLESREVYHPPAFGLVAYLRLADRDGDGRLSWKEWSDYLDVQERLVTQATVLTWVDRGPSLFELLDSDHDGKLSPRELRATWQRLAPWDRDRRGSVGRLELPSLHQALLTFGPPRGAGAAPSAGSPDGFDAAALLPAPAPRRGPIWFRKMDRNGDGDVSPKEFLGTPEQFRALDADGDGLIDPDEAELGDARLRGKR